MILISYPLSPELYLDPGSGSIVLQMIIAAILGAGVIIRSQWSKIKRWFGGKPAEDNDAEDDGDN
ncbi:MAG: hypothetical protein KPEEDBHJ_02794 [Anaerolineales bacterium]|nr:hypothetical protein [Anaerolineales bacterium]